MPTIHARAHTEFPWASRWGYLARAVGLAPEDPVIVALSGGADSVLLLHRFIEAGQCKQAVGNNTSPHMMHRTP